MEIINYDVTCIMPVYNTQKYVKDALLSILKQEGNLQIQIIVVDDGSTDNSVAIIKKLQKRHRNIELYQQQNRGPAVARNFAMKKVLGKYIMFIDSDDLLPSNAIQKLHVNAISNNSQIVTGMYEAFNRRRRWQHESMRFFVNLQKDSVTLEHYPELINNMSPWNKIYLTEFLRQNDLKFLENVQLREDIYFVCNALYRAARITVIPDIVYYYRGRDEAETSLTTRLHVRVFQDIFLVSHKLDEDESKTFNAEHLKIQQYRYQNELSALVFRLWPYFQRYHEGETLLKDVQKFLQKIGNGVIMTASADKRAILYKIKKGEFDTALILIRSATPEQTSFTDKLKNKLKPFLKKVFWKTVNAVLTPAVIIIRRKHTSLWLIGEQHGNAAKDTGYQFFLFCRKYYPDFPIYFVTKPGNITVKEIKQIGNVIRYGSIHNYLFARAAKVYVFSDSFKDLFWDWQGIKNVSHLKTACFLQHGIFALKYSHDYYNKNSVEARGEKIDFMVVSSEKEKEYVSRLLGYSEKDLVVTGLSRFDRLQKYKNMQAEKVILYSPTWRNYLRHASDEIYLDSSFHKAVVALTKNSQLLKLLHQNNYRLHICFHHATKQFTKHYTSIDAIYFSDMTNVDLFEELIRSTMLITDYSSVAFNMAYIDRPVVFYQFDEEEFVISEGGSFIDFSTELFGLVTNDVRKIVDEIEYNILNNFPVREAYKKKSDIFFSYKDSNNSKRIFKSIQQKAGDIDG